MKWTQIQFLAAPWRRGHVTVAACIALLLVAVYSFESLLSAAGVNCPEYLLGASRWGLLNGMLWQPFTYLWLHDLHSPWPILLSVVGFMLAGCESEAILGRRHFFGLVATASAAGAIAHALVSPAHLLLGAQPAVCAFALACTTILPEWPLCLPGWPRLWVPYKYLGWALILVLAIFCWRGHASATHGSAVASLVGALTGCIYARYLGFGSPWRLERRWRERRNRDLRLERMSCDQFMREQVDPVLEKIRREGFKSLTRAEHAILQRARQKLFNK
ncbi:MAG: rhomboid family intramembrane serine protease [Verrucomicrobia bacterium]|nr:rhomboid family intramembrane serine protease [Verrucomicrobiota bacterium]